MALPANIYGDAEPMDSGHSFMVTLCDITDKFQLPGVSKIKYIDAVMEFAAKNSDGGKHFGHSYITDEQRVPNEDQFEAALEAVMICYNEHNRDYLLKCMADWSNEWQENYGVSGELWH